MESCAQSIPIVDIRRGAPQTVTPIDILNGLLASPKSLPSLALWDSRGLQLFTKITKSEGYYLSHAEAQILHRYADDIAGGIEDGATIIELGAGNLNKSGYLIRALERQHKHIEYLALDVDAAELEDSLARLVSVIRPKYVRCGGILGTYDDCIAWMEAKNREAASSLVLLWLGSSICNIERAGMADILSRLIQGGRKMIVAVDGCEDPEKLAKAYDMAGGMSADFVLNGLLHTNILLGSSQFDVPDWCFSGRYNVPRRTFNSFVVAKRQLTVEVDGVAVDVEEGEEILMITSGKMSNIELGRVCKPLCITVSKFWKDKSGSYSLCQLQEES